MARLRNVVTKIGPRGFRAVLFRMVPKLAHIIRKGGTCFRAMLVTDLLKHIMRKIFK